jgi:competence protein ComEC
LGAAAAYYGKYRPLIPGGILVILGLACFFRAAASLPGRFRRESRAAVLCLLSLGLGCTLGLSARAAVRDRPLVGLRDREIRGIRGVLREDPRTVRGGRGMGLLDLEETAGGDGLRVSARGRMSVFFPEGTVPRLRTFGRGSRVFVEGALIRRDGGEPFFRAESVHIITPPPTQDQLRTGIRLFLLDRFSPERTGTYGGGGGSWGGLALALLVGIRDNLEDELAAAYRQAGCSHVLALSGMHLGIVSAVIAFLLRKPLGLRAAAVTGVLFVLLYVYLAGVQPSLERSAIMYLLGTLALTGALPRKPFALLGLTFLIQIILRPESGDSLSFILSYLALAGILTLGEGLQRVFRGRLPELLSQPLSASIGAFIATAAVSAAFFGVLRPVGILAGILIVPLTTVFMITSMIWLALNCLFPLVSLPAGFVLSVVYDILSRLVQAAGRAPGIAVSDPGLVFGLSAAAGALLILWTGRIKMRSYLAPFG